MSRNWIKLWVDQTLRGSMIAELTPEQRWIFIGLLLMAGDSDIPGVIYRRKNENGEPIGYATAVLADELGVESGSIAPAIKRMIEKNKVAMDALGVISISNWKKYQSEYSRQKPYRNKSDSDDCNESSAVDIDRERDRDREEEEEVVDSTSQKASMAAIREKISEIVKRWNAFAHAQNIPWVRSVIAGSARERHLIARMKDPEWDFGKILEAISFQPFLTGENDRGWLVTFDWILSPSNAQKILEGAYTKIKRGDRTGAKENYR